MHGVRAAGGRRRDAPGRHEDFEPALKLLFNETIYALVNSFGSTPEGLGVRQSILEPERAVITLATYTLVFFLIQAPLLRRRDVA